MLHRSPQDLASSIPVIPIATLVKDVVWRVTGPNSVLSTIWDTAAVMFDS